MSVATNESIDLDTPTPKPCESSLADNRRNVHVLIQGKGGIGKTLVAMNVVQYLREVCKQPVTAIDLDPMNHTLAEYTGLHAESVELFDDAEHVSLSGSNIDTMMQAALTEDVSTVIDNGAAGFVRYCSYLAETDIAGLLAERGRELIVHAVIAGGDMTAQCILGLNAILTTLPESVRIVVWLNEHSGPIEYDGMGFEDMKIYLDNVRRITALVRLPRLSPLFLHDFNTMLKQRLTYQEAIDAFHLMPAQRLTMVRRRVWDQLASIPAMAAA